MRRSRRNHTAAFKAKLAVAALKGDKTSVELAEKFDLHTNQITQLRTQLLETAAEVFLTPAAKMGITAISRQRKTSAPHPAHPIYSYLRRGLTIDRPNHCRAADISYIPMRRGLVYLVAIIDWVTRKVLAHRVSIGMSTDFCVEALEEAISKYGRPEIFNTDQGSQFTSAEFANVLKANGIRISMDAKGRWIDNVFVERIWKSVKYEHIYLHAYESVAEAGQQLASI